MSNVCLGDSKNLEVVFENNLLSIFDEILLDRSVSVECIENILWAVGNFTGKAISTRNTVMNHQLLHTIKLYQTNTSFAHMTDTIRATLAWIYGNFLRGKPFPPDEVANDLIDYVISLFMSSTMSDLVTEGVWAINYYLESKEQTRERVSRLTKVPGLYNRIVKLLLDSQQIVVLPAIKIIGNSLFEGDEFIYSELVDFDLINVRVANLSLSSCSSKAAATSASRGQSSGRSRTSWPLQSACGRWLPLPSSGRTSAST